jgi:hypothetical protein
MCGRHACQLTVVVGVLLVFVGCAGTTAPKGYLPKSTESGSYAKGAWAAVDIVQGKQTSACEGELFAVHADSLFVLTREGLLGIDQRSLSRVRLTTYVSEAGRIGIWTLLGSLSTASHGVGLIFSLPTWILTGSLSGSAASREPIYNYSNPYSRLSRSERDAAAIQLDESKEWNDLRKWARFPQGLPPALDQTRLRLLAY